MINRLQLAGAVARAPETRLNPAGIPLTRFALDHHSEQEEAGLRRQVQLRITVMATGDELSRRARRLQVGEHVTVTGFLQRTLTRNGQPRLVLHAQQLTTD